MKPWTETAPLTASTMTRRPPCQVIIIDSSSDDDSDPEPAKDELVKSASRQSPAGATSVPRRPAQQRHDGTEELLRPQDADGWMPLAPRAGVGAEQAPATSSLPHPSQDGGGDPSLGRHPSSSSEDSESKAEGAAARPQ